MKVFISVLFFFLALLVNAQNSFDKDVPEAVQKNFNKKFPKAENVSWDKVDSNYKVDCFYKGQSTYA